MKGEFEWMPAAASSFADDVDRLYAFLWLVSGIMSVLIGVLILYFAVKYRANANVDRRESASSFLWMEAAWIVGPFAVMMVMYFWGARLYFHQNRPPTGTLDLTGVGRQWMWKFQHPAGPAEINDLHVPVNQPVKIRLISEDVIHSLFIPAFRTKFDVLPGRYTTLWFEPTRIGEYHLFCAEYCGTKHSEMRGTVHVLAADDYQNWLAHGAEAVSTSADRLLDRLRCGSCHRGGGEGSRGPALEGLLGRTVRLQSGESVVADENYIRESILRPQAKVVAGFQPIMPSFEGQVSEEAIQQLIAEIGQLKLGSLPSEGSDEP